jgi:Uma2 family endonuclease
MLTTTAAVLEPAALDIPMPPTDLPTEDGVPLESNWHRLQMNLLIDSVHSHWRGRPDYFAGGNMFIYFSSSQARNRDYRGPDVFVVKDVDGTRDRDAWLVWEEEGRYPNVIVELSSPSTIDVDLKDKKRLYEKTFRTPEYFCYDPGSQQLWGWRLVGDSYVPIAADEEGALWSEQLELWLGRWQGEFMRLNTTWLRLWTPDGDLVPTPAEAEAERAEAEAQRAQAEAQRAEAEAQRAQAEAQRAQAEAQRAEAAEAEVARLRARLASLGVADVDQTPQAS